MKPGVWLAGLLLLALGLGAPPGEPTLAVGALGLGALLLQAGAEGPFCAAPALTMTAALAGGGLAGLISVFGLVLRSALRPGRSFLETVTKGLNEAVPELATLGVIAFEGGWLGGLVYIPLAWLWGQRSAVPVAVASAFLLAASLNLVAFPIRVVPLVILLAVLQRLPSSERGGGAWSLARRTLQENRRKSQEQMTLEQLQRALTNSRDQLSALDAILQVVATVCPSRSRVIFLCQEGRLVPVRYQSPLQDKLEAYTLLDLPEPVVEAAWQSRTSLSFPPLPERARLFEGERFGVVLLLEQEGVLYVGRPQSPLTEDELRLLQLVAAQTMPALRVVHSRVAEQQAVEQYHREHRRLEEELQRVQSLLDGTRQMVSTLDFASLEERLEVMLRASIPHDFGAVLTLSGGQVQPRRQWGARLDAPAAIAVAQAVLANGLPLTLEGPSRLAPLTPSQAALTAAPMQLEAGSTGVLILGLTRGTFEREHQDLLWMIGCLAAISFSNAGLHQEVLSAQAQLIHASKLAAVGQLAAGVAHELNTPLGAIRLNLDGLVRQLKEPEKTVERKLERARMAAGHAHEIVEKLLIYCRDDRSEYAPVELGSVVSQTLELVQSQLQKDGIEITTDLHPTPPVKGSYLELRQVLTNMLMNARDAAQSPGATGLGVRVQTRCQDGQVLLQVVDQGPGVAPEVLGRIFEPFFTTKPVGRGTGLGLSISHRIAAKHGGALEYESPPAGGACFSLRLPVGS